MFFSDFNINEMYLAVANSFAEYDNAIMQTLRFFWAWVYASELCSLQVYFTPWTRRSDLQRSLPEGPVLQMFWRTQKLPESVIALNIRNASSLWRWSTTKPVFSENLAALTKSLNQTKQECTCEIPSWSINWEELGKGKPFRWGGFLFFPTTHDDFCATDPHTMKINTSSSVKGSHRKLSKNSLSSRLSSPTHLLWAEWGRHTAPESLFPVPQLWQLYTE